MLKYFMKALKLVLACSMAVGISAYIPEIQPKEVKATEAAQLSENTKWTGTISAVEPRNDGDTYHIYTGEELAWVAEQTNKGITFEGKTILLENDIDLDFISWIPIGQDRTLPFMGTLEGNGKTISNLQLEKYDDTSYTGLFGVSKYATLQNFKIEHVRWTKGNYTGNSYDNLGIVSADLLHSKAINITVNNAHITGGSNTLAPVGGITCVLSNGSWVIDCTVMNSVFEGRNIGGIVSDWEMLVDEQVFGKYGPSGIVNCASINNELRLTYPSSTELYAGGIVSNVNTGMTDFTGIGGLYFLNNYAVSTISVSDTATSKKLRAGGLIGGCNDNYAKPLYIKNCYTSSTIPTNTTESYAGAVIGYNANLGLELENIYYSDINGDLLSIGMDNGSNSSRLTNKSVNSMKTETFADSMNVNINALPSNILPLDMNGVQYEYRSWYGAEGVYPSFVMPHAESIEIYPTMVENNQDIIFISNNIDQQVNALVKPYCSQREAKVTWSITPELGLSISETGLLSAKNAEIGAEAELQATYNGIAKTVKIRVVDDGQIMSLKINNPGFLEIGSTKKLTVTTYPSNADLSMIRWYINGEELNGQMQYVNENELASLDSVTGLLTMKQQGKITITVKQNDVILDEITLLIHSTTWDGISSTQPAYENNTYHITTGAELRWIAEQVNVGNTFAGKTILLENSIDLGGKNSTPANWQVIGNGANYFSGIFDGQGFTIRNLYSVTDDSTEFNGLFGWLPNAVVKNLNVDGFVIGSPNSTSEKHKVAIIGYISGQCKLENIHIENGKVTSSHYAGGLAGIVWSGTDTTAYVNQCKVENVTVQGQNSGGLIGSFKGILLNSSVSGQGSVQGNEKAKELYIGGLIGTTVDNSTIVNSYADIGVGYLIEGSNSETVAYTGGLIGYIQSDITLNNIYANGTIINKKSQGSNYLPGAIAGKINIESITLDNLNHIYWNKEAEHQNSSGVINGELKAFGTGDTSLSATNKSTSCTKEFFLNNLSTTLNANAVDQTDWLGWTSDGKTMPQLTNSAPVVIEIKQDDLYLRRNESVVLDTIMKPYNSTKKIDVTWELEGDTSSISLTNDEVSILPEAVIYATGIIKMTATDENGQTYTDSIMVTVMPDETEVTSLTIKNPGIVSTGDKVQMEAEVEPANALKDTIIWSIKKGYEKKATITSDGLLTANISGVIIIEVRLGSKTAEYTLTIQAGQKWDGSTVEEPDNDGQTYYITKASELAWVAQETLAGHYEGFTNKTILLMNDIDLNNKNWIPIGDVNSSFKGTFNGNGKTIRNLTFENGIINEYGLFGTIENALVKNVTVDKAYLNEPELIGAVFVGKIKNSVINNIVISNAKIDEASFTGLFARDIETADISNVIIKDCTYKSWSGIDTKDRVSFGFSCTAKGTVNLDNITLENNKLSGICNPFIKEIRVADIDNIFRITNISVSGNYDFVNNENQYTYFGGILGISRTHELWMQNCSFNGNITQHGNVSYLHNYFGGLIGWMRTDNVESNYENRGVVIENCYSTGSFVTNFSNPYSNGLISFTGSSPSSENAKLYKFNHLYSDMSGMTESFKSGYGVSTDINENMNSDLMKADRNIEGSLVNLLNANLVFLDKQSGTTYNTWISSGDYPTFGKIKLSSIQVSPSALVLRPGETYQLSKDIQPFGAPEIGVTWSSSNTNYATVDGNGNVTILKNAPSGKSVKITMTPIDSTYAPSICTITILPPYDEITSIVLTGKSESVVNETIKITAEVMPETADDTAINWRILEKPDGSNATISTKGTLNTGSTVGELVIEASAKSNPEIKGTLNITVKEKQVSALWDGSITEPVIDAVNKIIHIKAASELAWIAQQTNSGGYNGFNGYHIYLDNDLDMNKQPWTPIGTETYNFKGTFNGNGHVISNLYSNDTSEIGGLFGYVENLSLSNLILDSVIIEGKPGGLVAYSTGGNSSVVNVSVTGNFQNYAVPFDDSKKDIRVIGGFFGRIVRNSFLYIDQCTVNVKGINLTNLNYIGGLIGSLGNSNAVIRNNQIYIDYEVNRNKLAGEENSKIVDHYGGVIGLSSSFNLKLENNLVYHTSNINATYLYSLRQGGLVGTLAVDGSDASQFFTSVQNNYVNNNVTSNNETYLILRKNEIFGTLDAYNNAVNDLNFISYYDTSSVIDGTLSKECRQIAAGNNITGINLVKSNVVMVDPKLAHAPASNPDALVNKLNQWVSLNNQDEAGTYKTWIIENGTLTFGETVTVSLNKNELNLRIGESNQLLATVLPSSANASLTWKSSNPLVASVDQKGIVKGLIPGKSIITATTIDGYSASCTVTVSAAPTKLTLSPEGGRTTLIKDNAEEGNLVITAISEPVEAREINWSVSDESIVAIEVDTDDKTKVTVSAKANGNASIYAETENGIKASVDVSVIVPVSTLNFDSELVIDAAHELVLHYQVNEDASNKKVNWEITEENTENTSVLTVLDDSTISFKGSSQGVYKITASSEDGYFTQIYEIQVVQSYLDSIKIIPDEGSTVIMIERGVGYPLRSDVLPIVENRGDNVTMEEYAGVIYEVIDAENHPGITIDDNVLLADETVLDGERFKVKATTSLKNKEGNALSDEIEVIVSRTELQTLTIKMFDDSILPSEVGVNERLKLKAEASPSTASDKSVKWSVSDSTIAVIDETGMIQFLKEGTVQVKAVSANGLISAEHNFTVKAIYAESITIRQGDKVGFYKTANLQLTIQFSPQNVTQKKLTYQVTNDPNGIIKHINEDGLIEFNLAENGNNVAGTATVKVTAESVDDSLKVSDEITIICSDTKTYVTSIHGIKRNSEEIIHVGDHVQYSVDFEPTEANQTDFKWEVLDEIEDKVSEIAEINENTGEVTALAKGKFRIRVSIDYGAESTSPAAYISDAISIEEAEIESIGFNVSSLTLNAGSISPVVKAIVQPKDYVSQKVLWTSNHDGITFVDEGGQEITDYTDQPVYIKVSDTIKPGISATVKAQAENSTVNSTFNVLILRTSGTSIQVESKTAELVAGAESMQIKAVILANDGKTPASSQELLFNSSNPDIASVDALGNVKPKLAGTATITIKSKEDETVMTTITVTVKEPALEELNLNITNVVLLVGNEDKELRIELPQGSSANDFEWMSSDESVVSIKAMSTTRGIKLHALKPGNATITVQQAGNTDPLKIAQCNVKVVNEPVLVKTIELSGPEKAIELNEVAIIKAVLNKDEDTPSNETLEWWSDSPEIIKVLDETGTFTRIQVLKAQGSVTIHARAKDGSGIESSIVIKTAGNTPTGIQIERNFIIMSTSGSETVRATIEPSSVLNQQVTWSVDQVGVIQPINSSKPVITIQPMPNVTPGSYVTLTARTYNGLEASCTVLITDKKVDMIKILKSKLDVELGSNLEIPLEIDPYDASKKTLRWSISDETVLRIEDNTIIPLSEGTAVIKAFSTDGSEIESNECVVTVIPASPKISLSKIQLNINETTITPGRQQRLKLIPEPMDYDLSQSEVNWTYEISGLDGLLDQDGTIKGQIENTISLNVLGKMEIEPEEGPQLGLIVADVTTALELKQLMTDNSLSEITVVVSATIGELTANSTIHIVAENSTATIDSIDITNGDGRIEELALTVNEQTQLIPDITASGGELSNVEIIWSSSDENVVTIDYQTGIVKAINAGTATVELSVSTNNDDYITKEILVTVNEDLTYLNQVYLSSTELELAVGKSELLTYELEPAGYNPTGVVWKSSNESVAIVSDGSITTLSEGSTIITVDVDGYLGFCLVTVSSEFETPVKEITTDLVNDYGEIELSNDLENPSTLALNAHADSEATNPALVYQSSDETVATVDKNGIITGLKEGLAIITIRPISDKELYSKQVFIKVIPQTQYTILLDQQELTLVSGSTSDLTALITPQLKGETSVTYAWESLNPEIASISSGSDSKTATINALSTGAAEIKVTVSIEGREPLTAQMQVTVKEATIIDAFKVKTNEIEYTVDNGTIPLSLDKGGAQAFTIISEPTGNEDVNITFSNPEIVSISKTENTYELSALKAGSTTISFKSVYDPSKTVTFNLTITDDSTSIKPESITLKTGNNKNTLEINESVKLIATVLPAEADQGLYYSSSNQSVATVDQSGRVTGINEGQVTITAYSNTDMKISGSILLSIVKPEPKPAVFTKLQIEDKTGKVYDYDTEIFKENGSYVFKVENTVSRKEIKVNYELSQSGAKVSFGDIDQVSGSIIDFTNDSITYTLIAEDGTKSFETVSVLLNDAPTQDAEMTIESAFINNNTYDAAKINESTYRITVPYEVFIENDIMRVKYSSQYASNVYVGADIQESEVSEVGLTREIIYTLIGQNGKKHEVILQIETGPVVKTMTLKQNGSSMSGSVNEADRSISFIADSSFDLTKPLEVSITTDSYQNINGSQTITLNPVVTYADTKDVYYTGTILFTADDNTQREYTIQVKQTVALPKTIIDTLKLKDKEGNEIAGQKSTIDGNLILVSVPFGTDLTEVALSVEPSDVSISVDGKVLEFYDLSTRKTIIASQTEHADSTYTLIVSVESGSAEITSITLAGITVSDVSQASEFNFVLPIGIDLTALIPTFTLSDDSAKILINGKEYLGTAIDFTKTVTVTVVLNNVEKTYFIHVEIADSPAFIGIITISQSITTDDGTEIYSVSAAADNKTGKVEFEAEAGKFKFGEPFTISYKSTEGSQLYEDTTLITDSITLSTSEKSFKLKTDSEESTYTFKVNEIVSSGIDITKFDLINVPVVGTISGRIDQDRKKIYLDVLVDYTEDFTSMTLDIEADADMILVNGKVVNGPITLNLSNPVNVTFMKNGEVTVYEVITSSVVEGPYVSVFEILNTKEGTLTGVIDNKNRVINIEVPMTISSANLRSVSVQIDVNNIYDASKIIISGPNYNDTSKVINLRSLQTEITLTQNNQNITYEVIVVRPKIDGDMNRDGYITATDVQLLLEAIK